MTLTIVVQPFKCSVFLKQWIYIIYNNSVMAHQLDYQTVNIRF